MKLNKIGLILMLFLYYACTPIYTIISTSLGKMEEKSMKDRNPSFSKKKEGDLNGIVALYLGCLSKDNSKMTRDSFYTFPKEYNYYLQFKQLHNKNGRKSYGIMIMESLPKDSNNSEYKNYLNGSIKKYKNMIEIFESTRYNQFKNDNNEPQYKLYWAGGLREHDLSSDNFLKLRSFLNNGGKYEFRNDTLILIQEFVTKEYNYSNHYLLKILKCKDIISLKFRNIQPSYCKNKD